MPSACAAASAEAVCRVCFTVSHRGSRPTRCCRDARLSPSRNSVDSVDNVRVVDRVHRERLVEAAQDQVLVGYEFRLENLHGRLAAEEALLRHEHAHHVAFPKQPRKLEINYLMTEHVI